MKYTQEKFTFAGIGMLLILMVARSLGQSTNEPMAAMAAALPQDPAHPNILYACIAQILTNPAAALVILVICVADWLIDDMPFIPSKYVKHCSVAIGASIFWLFTSENTVPKSFPHPMAVFIANGIVCGFIAFVLHQQVVSRVIDFFQIKKLPASEPEKQTP